MTHPIELNAAQAVHSLRLDHHPRHQESELFLADGIYFSWDAGGGDVTLDVRPELGVLFHARAEVRRAPEWLSFNLSLKNGAFAEGDVLGLAIECEGCAGESLPMFIRTARGDTDMQDTYLQDVLQGSSHRQTQTLFHKVSTSEPLCGEPGFHTLVMNLPKRDFSFELRDLRLFVVPAERGLTLGQPKLAAG